MRRVLRGIVRWVARVVAIVVVVFLVALAVIQIQGWFALRHELNMLHRQGISTRIADYVPPKVPANENAAPLYRKANSILRAIWSQRRAGARPLLGPAMAPIMRYNPQPWAEAITAGASTLTRSDWAQMRKWSAEAKGALFLIKEGVRRPYCQFPVEWEKGFDALFPDAAGMRECARVLVYEAMLREKQGERGALVRTSGDLFQMGDQIGQDPSLINQLVRYAIDGIGVDTLEHGLAHSSVSPSEARAVFDQLARVDLGPGLLHALELERAVAMQWFDEARAAKHSQREFFIETLMTSLSEPEPWLYVLPVRAGLNTDEAIYLRLTRRLLPLARLPYREAKRSLEVLGREADRSPGYAVLSLVYFSGKHGVFGPHLLAKRDTYAARIALAQAALAVKAYQAQTGRHARSLEEVQSALGWRLREDPFSGRRLRYHADDRGFLIYSIGEDLRDEGGRPPAPGTLGDLVWRGTWEPVAWREAAEPPKPKTPTPISPLPGGGGPPGPEGVP